MSTVKTAPVPGRGSVHVSIGTHIDKGITTKDRPFDKLLARNAVRSWVLQGLTSLEPERYDSDINTGDE